MVRTTLWIAVAIVAEGCAGLAGAILPRRWLTDARPILLALAAGVLVGTSCADLVPDALAHGAPAQVYATLAATMAAMSALEWAFGSLKRRSPGGRLATSLLAADALHNAADGAAIAAAFLSSNRLGIVTSVAVIIHELPEEMADYVLLREVGLSSRRALVLLTGVQMTAAVGAALTLVSALTWQRISAPILAAAAGTFLYIALADLLPALARSARARRSLLLQIIVGFVVGGGIALAESAL